MRPLKVDIQSLTTQKDAMLAEKTALKNEVKCFFRLLLGMKKELLSCCTDKCHLPVVMEAPASIRT